MAGKLSQNLYMGNAYLFCGIAYQWSIRWVVLAVVQALQGARSAAEARVRALEAVGTELEAQCSTLQSQQQQQQQQAPQYQQQQQPQASLQQQVDRQQPTPQQQEQGGQQQYANQPAPPPQRQVRHLPIARMPD